ncbi:transposase [Novosphingobium chloroacetimidivorans]|uniref:Transposase n=1 Tax=Novosphingobium chloroacetimidivorans TaxID=1428314 RepID=A0A7W7NXS5_9SPHN|nr:hypothetical protein [Novosphingobium chloroacetimidivorans]MBB4860993.1 transposase [Novosphingobium chloroacetimidivorans]
MKTNKTDPHNAAGLAQLARTGIYKDVHIKLPAAHDVRGVITARGHLVQGRVRLDNVIQDLCAKFGNRPGAGQGKPSLQRIMQAAHIPGLGEAITSLLSVRAELMEQGETDRRLCCCHRSSEPLPTIALCRRLLRPRAPMPLIWRARLDWQDHQAR